jgi:hypothetical protein
MWDERMSLAHAHTLFITFNLTIRTSGVAVLVLLLRYEKEIFDISGIQERRRGQAEHF